MYNFADSSVTASAFTSGTNTSLTLVATTAGLTTTAALVIYYDDQVASNSVTVSSLPAISGTVTIGAGTAQIGSVTASNISSLPDGGGNPVIRSFVFGYDYTEDVPVAVAIDNNDQSLLISGTVDAIIGSSIPAGTNRIGVVTIGGGTVTIGAGTAQIGSVTASISGTVPISISSVTVGNSVTIGSLPALAAGTAQIGSVTASISSNPSGALTTRFGSVTTANTAQITTAVTNTSRKYLFSQNISTGVVTIGVGFSPTTTQGIQLSPGSGIVFDSFCPTGAVYWLGATTGAAWSILEG